MIPLPDRFNLNGLKPVGKIDSYYDLYLLGNINENVYKGILVDKTGEQLQCRVQKTLSKDKIIYTVLEYLDPITYIALEFKKQLVIVKGKQR